MPGLIPFLWLCVYIAIGAALIYAFFWFMETICGIPLPPKAKQVTLGIYAVIVLIWVLTFLSHGGIPMPG